jgi:hypothetical protein
MKHASITLMASFGLMFSSMLMAEDTKPVTQASEQSPEVIEIKAEKAKLSDNHCLRETGTRIRSKDKNRCNYSAGRSYSREEIERTGSIDIGQALERLDPSVSVRRY